MFGDGSVGIYQYIQMDKSVLSSVGMYRGVLRYLEVGILGSVGICQIILRSLDE